MREAVLLELGIQVLTGKKWRARGRGRPETTTPSAARATRFCFPESCGRNLLFKNFKTITKSYHHKGTSSLHTRTTVMQTIFSTVTKQIQQLASPTVTKHYKLEGTIGKGNFSVVKRATDRGTGKEVAVKVINLDKFKNNEKVFQSFPRIVIFLC